MKLFLKGDRCFTPKCAVEPNKRPYPPGPHQQRRRKVSDFGVQLREKQKVRRIYGVLEKQFRKHFEEAERLPGATGENLLRVLEMRLDNVVYRFGFADSRAQARQLVRHGHFAVNGRKTDIPSAHIKVGDVIAVLPVAAKLEYFQALTKELGRKTVPAWLSINAAGLSGRVLSAPERTEIDASINEALVVEHYSR
jgi:small subunit ribosomal protein S4